MLTRFISHLASAKRRPGFLPALTALSLLLPALMPGGARAQDPLVPGDMPIVQNPMATQHNPIPAHVPTSGRSFISQPIFGSAQTRGPMVPRIVGSVLAPDLAPLLTFNVPRLAVAPRAVGSTQLWSPKGPDQIKDSVGVEGGVKQAASGRVTGLAYDPTDNNTYFVASAGGGVWKTSNGGASYIPLTDFLGNTSMGAVAVAPSDRLTVWAGGGEANNGLDNRYGNGLLKSTDGGTTWSVIPGPGGVFVRRAVSRIAIDPTNPSTVYVAIGGNPMNGLGGGRGVWKTADGGLNWTNTFANIDTANSCSDVVINPLTPTTLYAAIGAAGGATTNGIYKTTNGGGNWTLQAGGLPPSPGRTNLTVNAITVNQAVVETVYAVIANPTTDMLLGVYKTTDGGTTWAKLANAPNILGAQGFFNIGIAVSPNNPNLVFTGGQANTKATVGNRFTLAGSQDGGATWQDYSLDSSGIGPFTDMHVLTFSADSTKLLDGNDGGVWRLENPTGNPGSSSAGNFTPANITWTDTAAGMNTILFTGIATHPTDANMFVGGSQDNGSETTSGGALAWSERLGGDGGFSRIDQTTPTTFYAEQQNIALHRSDDAGVNFTSKITGIDPMDKSQFYVPYKLDPLNQSRLIYGTNNLYESTNRADSFTKIGIQGTNNFNPDNQKITNVGVAGPTVYAATGDNLYATTNNGGAWADRSIPAAGSQTDVFVNPNTPADVYVTMGRFGGGKVYHSTDGGVTWPNITGNLPDEPFNGVTVDLALGVIYVGADDGVFYSVNNGGAWTRLGGTTLPNVQVVNLELNKTTNFLAVGTHGRGLWTIPLMPPAADVTKQVKITQSGYTRIPFSSTYAQRVTLTNTSSAAISGPLSLVLDSLSAGVTLNSPDGTTSAAPPSGSPYRSLSSVSLPGGSLAPGASVSFSLRFTNTNTVQKAIAYSPRILAGPGVR